MPVSVTMPQLGESVVEGTVTRWLKKEGDQVATDEPLLEVSTDKVDTEIPSPAAGVLLRILAVEDETVAVGAELAVIGDANESAVEPAERAEPAPGSEAAHSAAQGAAQGAPDQQVASPEESRSAAEPSPPAEPDPPAPAPAASSEPGPTTSLTLPALGESVTEGTVTRWLKQAGDAVAVDEALLEVSTDKVDTEIPSPVAGILLSITVAEDQTVNVGGELAVIGPADGAAPASPPSQAPPEEQAQAVAPPQQSEPQAAPAVSEADKAEVDDAVADDDRDGGYVTPLVRKLASEYAVDLASVNGTGIGGRIRKQDVLEAAKHVAQQAASRAEPAPSTQASGGSSVKEHASPSTSQASPLRGRTEKMSRLRKVIAERMVESLQVSAQLTTVVEVDVTRIAHLRQRAKDTFLAREGVKLSFLPFFAKATVEALKVHPSVNANIDTSAGTVTYHDVENLGVAVDTERGLLVPVIHQAGDLNIAGLAKRIADVAERTRGGKISPDELSGGTFTLTNTGSRGALFDTPIINQPQVGVLGTGVVVKRPVVVSDSTGDDSIAIRWMVFLALTYDHRLVDGADATRFLTSIKDRLEEGAFEADLGL